MKIVIPWEYAVSKNNKFTVWRKGQPALTATYRDAKDSIYKIAKSQTKRTPFNSRVQISFDLYMPDRRRRDILNYMQIICDGLEGVAYENDALIDHAIVTRCAPDKDNPRVEVFVAPYNGEQK